MATARNIYKLLFILLLVAGAGFALNARHHHHRQHPALAVTHIHKQFHKQVRHTPDSGLPSTAFAIEPPRFDISTRQTTFCPHHSYSALTAPTPRGPPAA